MAGSEIPIEWGGRPAKAWLPEPLEGKEQGGSDDSGTVRRTERAAGAVMRLGDRLPAGRESLARLLLRAEGMASSNIEGLRAPVAEVGSAEMVDSPGVAGWVADNLAVVGDALSAPDRLPLDTAAVNSWHRRLMHRSSLPPEMIGEFRQVQNWIGGRTPRDAVFVPPPGRYVLPLMEDLVAYTNRVDLDPVLQAAVAHAQFETIHPYGDGNGRIGRVLVLWILSRRLGVAVPPPMSTSIARDLGGYLSGLHWFRAGDSARWVRWFAQTLERSATASMEWLGDVDRVLSGWRVLVAGLRSDAAARRLLELLPAHPVISSEVAARELGVSVTAARTALQTLATLGILSTHTESGGVGRPRRLWVAGDLVDLVGDWTG